MSLVSFWMEWVTSTTSSVLASSPEKQCLLHATLSRVRQPYSVSLMMFKCCKALQHLPTLSFPFQMDRTHSCEFVGLFNFLSTPICSPTSFSETRLPLTRMCVPKESTVQRKQPRKTNHSNQHLNWAPAKQITEKLLFL